MAKQLCDPFRGAAGQCIGHVKPSVAVEKGDLIARHNVETAWVVPFSELATVALCHSNFLGVANAAVAADQADRRLVINTAGRYMYPLVTASEVKPGDFLIPVLNGGSTACRNQEWNVAAANTYAIAVATKSMPDWEFAYTQLKRCVVNGEADDELFTEASSGDTFHVGDVVRYWHTSGTPGGSTLVSGNIYVIAAEGSAGVYHLHTAAGADVTITGDVVGILEQCVTPRTSDEAEGMLFSTLINDATNP